MPLPTPVIVIPGNPAVNLQDVYPVEPEAIFALTHGMANYPTNVKRFDRLPPHPEDAGVTLNASGQMVVPARVFPNGPFYFPYTSLVNQLRDDLGTAGSPAPVFPFMYDWRHDTLVSAQVLDAFISEVLRITALLPAYRHAGFTPTEVDIVAHSFGSPVLARYLCMKQQAVPAPPSRVRKVVTIAGPFQGAVDALYTMIGDLDQRKSARTLPSVYELLPWFPNAVVDVTTTPPVPVDLLADANIWANSSVQQTLNNYCSAMGSTKTGAARLAELLAAAAQQRADLTSLDVVQAIGSKDNWLPIVGIGSKTNAQVNITSWSPQGDAADFAFVSTDGAGDMTVPLEGAIPPFSLSASPGPTAVQRLVCFSTDDFSSGDRGGWMGIGERLGAVTLHAFLPAMDMVQRAVIGFLSDSAPRVKSKARPAPGVAAADVDWPAAWNVLPH